MGGVVEAGRRSENEKTGQYRAWLESYREEIRRRRDEWNVIESRWSWSRLLVFIAGVVPWFFWAATPLIPILLMHVTGAVFWRIVRRHIDSREQRELHDGILTVIDEARQRCGGELVVIRSAERPGDVEHESLTPPAIPDAGPTWALTDQERDDLDVFGRPVGLFGLLNRTSTAFGARRLRDMLDNSCLSAERIGARQDAVRRLEHGHGERARIMGATTRLRNEDKRLAGFVQAVHDARPLDLFASISVLRWWAVIGAALAMLALGHLLVGHFRWAWLLMGVVSVNGLLLRRFGKALRDALGPWRDVAWGAQGFLVAARQGAKDLPGETELAELRDCFHEVVEKGELPSLCRRIGWAEHGGGMHVALNYLALYDLHVAASILERAVPHREVLLAGIAALADLEALTSLACFAAEQPITCYPTPLEEPGLEINAGRHPLIPPARIIPNEIELRRDSRMWIITGSNMAGKSTFLRMAGVNVLLAQIGSAVIAEGMKWSPLRLMTDLQARDNLAEDESYFLAEVRHLRRMVLPPEDSTVLLGLIDEPFRGTNSQDQSAASVAVIKHLLRSPNLVLLATHDRRLTELADEKAARNFHFREDLSSAGMVFDYRLHDGPATTRNALRVLQREGYPQQILEDAQSWLAKSAGDESW